MSRKTALLLMGRSGNGLSLLADSILYGAQQNLETSATDHNTAVNNETIMNVPYYGAYTVNKEGRACFKIKINDDDITKNKDFLFNNLAHAFLNCTQSFAALLIVLKYGVRFTKQEKDVISLIKYLLGEDCVRNYGIIVFTYGDNFDLDYEVGDTHTNFSAWCREQRGDIQSLFDEVKYRCVIFDNKTTDENKKKLQRKHLDDTVDIINAKVLFTKIFFCEHLFSILKLEFDSLKKISDKTTEISRDEEVSLYTKLSKLNTIVDTSRGEEQFKVLDQKMENLEKSLADFFMK